MPHNNKVSGSGALRTNDMWSKTIGLDPHAAANEPASARSALEAQEQAESLMLLAKMSNLSGVESRGGCKKCGLLGHHAFQCRNAPAAALPTAQDDSSDSSDSEDEAEVRKNEALAQVQASAADEGQSDRRDEGRSGDDEREREREREGRKETKRDRKDSKKDSKKESKKESKKSSKKDSKHGKHERERRESKEGKHRKSDKSDRDRDRDRDSSSKKHRRDDSDEEDRKKARR